VSAGRIGAALGLARGVLDARVSAVRPFKLTLALTERCDCRCEVCFIWRKPKGREMTPSEIGGFLREAPSIRWVNLTGGEPFLRDDVPEVVEAVRAALPGLAVLTFPTTGQRTEAIVEAVGRIARLRIPRVFATCSVEGPPDLHDRLRGRPGAFERMTATYRALRAIPGVSAYFGLTLSDRNAGAVRQTLAALREAAPGTTWRDVHLNVYTESGHYYDNVASGVGPPVGVEEALGEALRAREGSGDPTDRIEATYLRLLPSFLRTGRSPIPCRSLRASVFIGASGDLYPCTVYGRRLGNVLETPLPDLLASDEAADARDVIERDRCPGCWSPCEAHPTIVASAPGSLLRRS
jgi:MoaA/NifB/PqqE/SkfB family radical SAM enzyme